MKSNFFKKLTFNLTLLAIFFSLIAPSAAFAQRRKAGSVKAKSAVAKSGNDEPIEACDGWRGRITYVQNVNDERVTNEEGGFKKFVKIVQVDAEVNLAGGSSGQGKVSIASRDMQETEQRRNAPCGSWMNERKNTFVEKHFQQFDESGAAAGNVSTTVSVNGGEYSSDVFMPVVRGKSVMRGKTSQKGYCNPENDNEQITNPIENQKQFETIRFRIQGKIDPQNPNVLRGTLKYDPNVTINWDLTRAKGDCEDGDLTVSGLKTEHHVFPNPTAWQEIGENTVDGNQVKLTATVSNNSNKSKSGTVTFREKTSGEILGTQSVSVSGGSEKEAAIVWDTNGYGWTDNGKNAPTRQVEASLSNGDASETEVVVFPKPVVLVHGLWSNGAAWSEYHNYLEEAHSFAWKAYAVGADPKVAQMRTGEEAGNREPTFSIRQNAQELGKQIAHTQKIENAWRVDVVAHSMGGLISRFYIHNSMTNAPDGKPTIANLVMLGTPNQGSPCADLMYPAYKAAGFEVEALRQLQPAVVAEFNSQITNRKSVKFSILVGTPVPRTCHSKKWGDGVVEIPSALWEISDRNFAARVHTSLTGREDFFAFVKPRLALGPKRAKQTASAENKSNPAIFANGNSRIGENWLASINPLSALSNLQTTGDTAQIVSSKTVKIAAGERAEIPFQAANAKTGVTFVAPPFVKASLVNADGEIEQTIEAGSQDAEQTFKTFYADKTGNKILRFENTGDADANAMATVWNDTNPLDLDFIEIQKQADGSVKLQAKLSNGGAVVKGAIITAKINNRTAEIALVDDSKHGDGAANDGIYGATTEKLAAGEHFIEARAAANNLSVTATAVLAIGNIN